MTLRMVRNRTSEHRRFCIVTGYRGSLSNGYETNELTSPHCYDSGVVIPDRNSSTHFLRTVFLDRDGVLNEKLPEGRYVSSLSHFHLVPGVADAISKMNHAGVRVLVVSNQRGVALGLYTSETVRAIHDQFQHRLSFHEARVDGFYFCPHDEGQCHCRKPLPGLFERAVADFPDIDPRTCAMIGDSLSDIEFGRRLGMRTIFLEGDSSRQKPSAQAARELADMRFSSLPEAVDSLLEDFSDRPAVRIS
jgi:D-glycero-D-manno-heptose 1,7-bisphosphate phosphatase